MYTYIILFIIGILFAKLFPLLDTIIDCLSGFVNIGIQYATCQILKLHASTADLENLEGTQNPLIDQIGFQLPDEQQPIEEEEIDE